MITVNGLNKIYQSKNVSTHALKDVSIQFDNSGLTFILGKSGCGKTTLMNLIGGLDRFDNGEIIVKNLALSNSKKKDLDILRNNVVGFVFQNFNIIDHLTVFENVNLSLKIQGKRDDNKVLEQIKLVGLEGLELRKMNELSGGQKQRVAIARALVKDTDIILCDEPTGNLDSETSSQIMDLLKELSKTRLIVVVSHDNDLAKNYSNRTISMSDGQVVSDDSKNTSNEFEKVSLSFNNDTTSSDAAKEVVSLAKNNKIVNASFNFNSKDKTSSNDNTAINSTNNDGKSKFISVIFKTAFSYLSLRKIRLALVIAFCTLLLSITTFFISVVNYDGIDDTITAIENMNYPAYSFNCSYADEGVSYRNTCNGEQLITVSNFTEDDFASRGYTGIELETGYGELIYGLFVTQEQSKSFNLIAGSENISDTLDIYITDYLASQIDADINLEDFLGTEYQGYTIKGIIDTDYEEFNFTQSELWNFYIDRYLYVVHHEDEYVYRNTLNGYIDNIKFNLQTLRFDTTVYERSYFDVTNNLLYGRDISSDDEMIISREQMCKTLSADYKYTCVGDSTDFDEFNQYMNTTLYLEGNSYTYNSILNDTFKDGYKIVGIMDDTDNLSIVISDDSFVDMFELDLNIFFVDESNIKVFVNEVYSIHTSKDIDYDITISSGNIDTFSYKAEMGDFDEDLEFLIFLVVIGFILIVLTITTLFLNFNFISKIKNKEAGILKSLGLRNRHLTYIYFILVLLMSVILITTTAIVSILINNFYSNMEISNYLTQYDGYKYLTFGSNNVLYIFFITFFAGFISVILPLRKVYKTETIDVIKSL